MKKVEQLERAVKAKKEETRTLKDLSLSNVREVVDKDAQAVLDETAAQRPYRSPFT